MGLRSNLNLSEPIVIHWLDARCFAVTEPRRESYRAGGKGRPRSPPPYGEEAPTAGLTVLAARGDQGRPPYGERTQRSRPQAASPV